MIASKPYRLIIRLSVLLKSNPLQKYFIRNIKYKDIKINLKYTGCSGVKRQINIVNSQTEI